MRWNLVVVDPKVDDVVLHMLHTTTSISVAASWVVQQMNSFMNHKSPDGFAVLQLVLAVHLEPGIALELKNDETCVYASTLCAVIVLSICKEHFPWLQLFDVKARYSVRSDSTRCLSLEGTLSFIQLELREVKGIILHIRII